nr:hypothetical protein pPsy0462c_00072 [Pseudomonas syringae]
MNRDGHIALGHNEQQQVRAWQKKRAKGKHRALLLGTLWHEATRVCLKKY